MLAVGADITVVSVYGLVMNPRSLGEDEAAAQGHFVHVFVDRASNTPVPIPAPIRAALEAISVEGA